MCVCSGEGAMYLLALCPSENFIFREGGGGGGGGVKT